MSTFVASLEVANPLDEGAWQAWSARGRAHDRRTSAARILTAKSASIAVLLGAAVFWSHLAAFEVAVRFLVTAGAIVVLFQALQQRAEVAVSAVPFVASPGGAIRTKDND